MNPIQRDRLWKRIRDEAPALHDDTCWRLGRDIVPVGGILPDIVPALDIIFARWRESRKSISFQTLDFLCEVARRVAYPDPAGWRFGPNQPDEALAIATAVETKFHEHAEFLMERYWTERRGDSTMERLWLELMLCVAVTNRTILPDTLTGVLNLRDAEHQSHLAWLADYVLGSHPCVTKFLQELAAATESVAGDVCRCLLACRFPSSCAVLTEDSDARIFVRNCPSNTIKRLRDHHFFPLAARVVAQQRWDELEGFSLIIEGLRRVFRCSGDFGFSSTTWGRMPEVSLHRLGTGVCRRPGLLTIEAIRFLKAIAGNAEIWRPKTNLWMEFGLPQGKPDLDTLISSAEDQFNSNVKILVLLSYRAGLAATASLANFRTSSNCPSENRPKSRTSNDTFSPNRRTTRGTA